MKIYTFVIIALIISCTQYVNNKKFPEQIGIYKLHSVVEGDSAIKEINSLHMLSVATENNIIVRYGDNSEDILYISKYEDNSAALEIFNKMHYKMQTTKNLPFSISVTMKNYKNSFMTLGMGSVHYVYQSSEYLLWYSTKQKFYNKIPYELLEIYPENH